MHDRSTGFMECDSLGVCVEFVATDTSLEVVWSGAGWPCSPLDSFGRTPDGDNVSSVSWETVRNWYLEGLKRGAIPSEPYSATTPAQDRYLRALYRGWGGHEVAPETVEALQRRGLLNDRGELTEQGWRAGKMADWWA